MVSLRIREGKFPDRRLVPRFIDSLLGLIDDRVCLERSKGHEAKPIIINNEINNCI